jgi:hypothetical protein
MHLINENNIDLYGILTSMSSSSQKSPHGTKRRHTFKTFLIGEIFIKASKLTNRAPYKMTINDLQKAYKTSIVMQYDTCGSSTYTVVSIGCSVCQFKRFKAYFLYK